MFRLNYFITLVILISLVYLPVPAQEIPSSTRNLSGTLLAPDNDSMNVQYSSPEYEMLAANLFPNSITDSGDQNDSTAQRLFHIERNKNANIVVYDAQVQSDGSLYLEQPVIVYWLMLAKDGGRQGLNKIENNRAYGFQTEGVSKDSVIIKLKANSGRGIKVRLIKDRYRAIITVGDKEIHLKHIYVMADDKGLRTSVQYVEIFGTDSKTGEDFYEKIVP